MAISISTIAFVAHLPLVLGMSRKLQLASIIDGLVPPDPYNVISCGRGVEALLLAILDGQHALYRGSPIELDYPVGDVKAKSYLTCLLPAEIIYKPVVCSDMRHLCSFEA